MNLIFLSPERVEELKTAVAHDERLARELRICAQKAMLQPPLSVTFSKSPAVSGDPHDYYSEGPYWWPDPQNPDGPYIRRDGERNPARFTAHVQAKNTLVDTVGVLANAGVFLGEARYFDKAEELLRVFFVDEATRMNPNLNHAQAIRGHCAGRGIGIIDTAGFIGVAHAVNLMEVCGGRRLDGVKAWFKEYLHWLNTSKNGLEEKHYHNNHANWWNAQAATFSALVGDEALLQECFDRFAQHIMPTQTDDEGGFTDEMTRTLSYGYSLFSLDASATLCEIAWHRGVDLWHAKLEKGKGMELSIAFMKPYYINPFLWKHQQIDVDDNFRERFSMKLAARRLGDAQIENANRCRREDVIPCRKTCYIGLIDLL